MDVPFYALVIRELVLGAQHPKTTETCKRFIALLHAIGQHEQASQLEILMPVELYYVNN